ncbi:MAG: tetratricopeptide repeat protein [bacterium]|nr:tetratricopeptide repeat protein [bacterium]
MKYLHVLWALALVLLLSGTVFAAGDSEPDPNSTPAAPSAYDQGRAEVQKGNWEAALSFFQKAVSTDSDNHKAHNMVGYTLRQLGKYKEALVAYGKALSIKPDYPEALEYRAMAHLKLGNRTAAVADYQRLVELDSSLAEELKEKIDKAPAN